MAARGWIRSIDPTVLSAVAQVNTEAPRLVVLAVKLPAAAESRLRSASHVLEVSSDDDHEAFVAALREADGVVLTSRTQLDERLLESAPNLRVISTVSVGLDHIDLEAARRRGIVVTTTPVLSDAVADLTMALMVMLARRLPTSAELAKTGRWSEAPLGNDLKDKSVLLVGFGRIGREVARRALACRMLVSFFESRVDPLQLEGARQEPDLMTGLRQADFVSLHVDLNPTTRHLIGSAELAAMKPTAFLVNTARGGVVDQAALLAALSTGAIAGAGLDVLEDEPPDPDDPLLEESRAIVLPHIGSATIETRTAMAEMAVDNLIMCLNGERCPQAV